MIHAIKSTLAAAAASMVLLVAAPAAQASTLLLNNLEGGTFSSTDEVRGPAFGILAQIVVGAANVDIGQFGVFGRQLTDGNIRFDIFDASQARVYNSGSVSAAAAATNGWYDSPTFSLTLLAGQTYYFGLLSDQQFNYHWELPATADVGLGLTSPVAEVAGSNGNFSNFADPTVSDYCCFVQQSTRIYGSDLTPTVPEPGIVGLALTGLGVVGVAARRRKLV